MEKNKMEKKNKVVESEKKINLNYIIFIGELINSKILINEKNKDNIIKLYSEKVNLRFSNLSRVNNRILRKEVSEKLNIVLEKNKIEKKEYIKVCEKVKDLSRLRSNNYF